MSQRQSSLVLNCSRWIIPTLLILTVGADASTEKVLHTFIDSDGAYSTAPFFRDAAGNLYGTTQDGGIHNLGTVFELSPTSKGWRETVLYSFKGGNDGDGANPYFNGVTMDAAGNLYGTTYLGGGSTQCYEQWGDQGCGTVFELTPKAGGGWTETVLYSFKGGSDGLWPAAGGVTVDVNGNLYGTTNAGGGTGCSYGCGTVFELTPGTGGWTETILYSFKGVSDGTGPFAGLTLDAAGNLYGTAGNVFELKPGNGGWTETVLYNFKGGNDGADPEADLIIDTSGNLYGTTFSGGGTGCGGGGCGTVYELSLGANGTWAETVLYSFKGGSDGAFPYTSGVILDINGNLYGTTNQGGGARCNCGVVFELTPSSSGQWTETLLHTFTDGKDGGYPSSGLVFDAAGALYGPAGSGVVFRLVPQQGGTWAETVIHIFASKDGLGPLSGLIFDVAGNLYGTTTSGGHYNVGTVIELMPTSKGWKEQVIYDFRSGKNGLSPDSGLILDAAGNLYGTAGGGRYGHGTVFELMSTSKGWKEQVIYDFRGGKDGLSPEGGLIFDAAGNLFGTTRFGGQGHGDCCGTVFELSPSSNGWTETVLYRFTGGNDGFGPYAGVVFDAAGNLYGTTSHGASGEGSIFELMPSDGDQWTVSVLYRGLDGPSYGSLVIDSAGNLYGTMQGGTRRYDYGSVFELARTSGGWAFKGIYGFAGGSDGEYPTAGLLLDAVGNLYGTTAFGGAHGHGTVFKLAPSGSGWTESRLYNFKDGADGGEPEAELIVDTAGNLYSTANQSGITGIGVIYEVTP